MQPTNDVAQPYKLETMKAADDKDKGGFDTIPNTPLPEPEWTRLLDRQNYAQPQNIQNPNKTITVTSPIDGSVVGMGIIPGTANEFGFFSTDATGAIIWKRVGGTGYVYNPADSYHNVVQDGLLPDGSGGLATAKTGYDVADGIS